VVIASNAGEPTHLAWFLNLQDRPAATVQIGRTTTAVRAREAEGDERARLWKRMAEIEPAYDEYVRRIGEDRRIPLVVLEPERTG